MNYERMTAAQMGKLIAAGKLDPVELAEFYLNAIEHHAFSGEIFARVTSERARVEAQASRLRQKTGELRGPLDGVPVSWKDLYDTKDIATESGAPMLKGRIPGRDAEVLEKAGAAGTVCLGKTHMTEFAFSGLGINPNTATPPNTDFPSHCPGGSSSGAAAAIAHNLAPISIGSDTGGSVRIPACWNSLVGMKTTYGLLSLVRVVPLCPGFDTVGPLAKTVEDCALMIAAMGGGSTNLDQLPEVSDLHFAIAGQEAFIKCDDAVVDVFEMMIEKLQRAGAKITRIETPEFQASLELGTKTFPFEAWHSWGSLIDANPDVMYVPIEERFRYGAKISNEEYLAAWEALRGLRQAFWNKHQAFDAILLPTTPILPPAIAPLLADHELFSQVNLLALRNTRFGNLFGACALTLPSHEKGIGLQIMGKPMHDQRILQIGQNLERMFAH